MQNGCISFFHIHLIQISNIWIKLDNFYFLLSLFWATDGLTNLFHLFLICGYKSRNGISLRINFTYNVRSSHFEVATLKIILPDYCSQPKNNNIVFTILYLLNIRPKKIKIKKYMLNNNLYGYDTSYLIRYIPA